MKEITLTINDKQVKLGVNTRPQAVSEAIKRRLIYLSPREEYD